MVLRHILSLSCLSALTHSFSSARTIQGTPKELAVVLVQAAKRASSAATVGSYGYIGCWTEPAGVRALPSFSYADNAMTAEMCSSKCAGNYQFWGLEYGRECWCADSIAATSELAPASDCNFDCSGDSDEICGASWRLSVYNSSTIIPLPSVAPEVGAYSYVGCQNESPAGTRALNESELTSPYMTNEMCAETCSGYAMFGTEYGSECYCGNHLTPGSTPADEDECNIPCAGNSLDLCGGYWKFNLYSAAPKTTTLSTIAQIPASTSTSSPDSLSSAPVSTASLSSSTLPGLAMSTNSLALVNSSSLFGVSTSTILPATSSSSSIYESSTPNILPVSSSSSGSLYEVSPSTSLSTILTSTKTSISPAISLTPVPTANLGASSIPSSFLTTSFSFTAKQSAATFSATALPPINPDWKYVGCFNDIAGHDMTRLFKNDSMTPELCMEVAKEHLTATPAVTYRYIGLEYGRECYAATSAPSPVPTSLTGRKACTMTCKGNGAEMCGGGMQYNLYASVTEKPLLVPVTTSVA